MRKTIEIVGVNIDDVTIEEAVLKVREFLEEDRLSMIFTPNSEILVDAVKDPEFSHILNDGSLVVPDGIGVVKASRYYNTPLKERVAGYDLMLRIIEEAYKSEKSVYILGGKPKVAEAAAAKLEEKYKGIRIEGVHDGYFDSEEEIKILEEINRVQPDILFVALGAPRQEKWIYRHKDKLKVKIAMGVGGSIDVIAGRVKRAPEYFQKAGLEWFYRLLKEPSRIGRMMKLPKFIMLAYYDAKMRTDK